MVHVADDEVAAVGPRLGGDDRGRRLALTLAQGVGAGPTLLWGSFAVNGTKWLFRWLLKTLNSRRRRSGLSTSTSSRSREKTRVVRLGGVGRVLRGGNAAERQLGRQRDVDEARVVVLDQHHVRVQAADVLAHELTPEFRS